MPRPNKGATFHHAEHDSRPDIQSYNPVRRNRPGAIDDQISICYPAERHGVKTAHAFSTEKLHPHNLAAFHGESRPPLAPWTKVGPQAIVVTLALTGGDFSCFLTVRRKFYRDSRGRR